MMNLTKSGWTILGAILTAFVGLVLYIVTSTTGYLAGTELDLLPIIFTVLAILLASSIVIKKDLKPLLIDLFIFATTILLIASLSLFLLGRVSLIADVYFIPVNYPVSEEIAVNISIAGFISYAIAIITMIVIAFSKEQ